MNGIFPDLLKWQINARQSLINGFRNGHRRQILCCPTGGGKTILALYLINECLKKGYKAVFMADRRSLIHQTSYVASQVGLQDHSIFMADSEHYDPNHKFQIASIQTISRRFWPRANLYIIDEAHTMMKTWTKQIKETPANVIGLTATPFTKGLGNYFTNLVNASTMSELTALGVLVPLQVYAGIRIDTTDMKISDGEWDANEIEYRGRGIIGNVIKEWKDRADGRKTIVFGANVRHCEAMCREFNAAGITAAMYVHTTQESDRIDILNNFKYPDSAIKILLTVEALAKGFDNPYVSCICDVRPLRKSFSTAVQMWGRALRRADNKPDALLLDFSGNILRFRSDFENLYYYGVEDLKSGARLDHHNPERHKADEKECPSCHYYPFAHRCVKCGFEYKKSSKVNYANGMMKKLAIRQMNKDMVWKQCVALCRKQGNPETAMGRSWHLYKAVMGEFPEGLTSYHDIDITGIAISEEVANKQRYLNVKYHMGRKKYA